MAIRDITKEYKKSHPKSSVHGVTEITTSKEGAAYAKKKALERMREMKKK